ncbi:hypothetical protein E4K72_15235 [Oxalobacteraceae bacterium OM1]|nr:hypothetical protein E4K72_15235 [Oxalobacteraceae bacterium OM1]
MSHDLTSTILQQWYRQLSDLGVRRSCRVQREYRYIDQPLPFRALHMGKKNDEYFLDANNQKITVGRLLNDLELLVIKDFNSLNDLSLGDKQAKKATSIADIHIEHANAEIVIELEVFKDKPFSNLIFVPQACAAPRKTPLIFIHCFAPERHDKEAELTRRIGKWLEGQPLARDYTYLPIAMPALPESIRYLLPPKQAKKPLGYQHEHHEMEFARYIHDFGKNALVATIDRLLCTSSSATYSSTTAA